jgi:hypothetical protein
MSYFYSVHVLSRIFSLSSFLFFFVISNVLQLFFSKYVVTKNKSGQHSDLLSKNEDTKKNVKVFSLLTINEYIG